MDIKNQIRLNVLISVLIVAAIAFSFVLSSQNVQELQEQELLAAEVVRGGYELTYLSNNYIINAEPRARTQWEERYTSLQPIISQLKPTNVEETKSIESIRDYNEKVGTLFHDIPEPGVMNPGSSTFPPGFQQVTWSRSNVQSQGMIYEAWRLRHLYNDDVSAARLWNNVLVLALMAAMLLIIGINYVLISRRLVRVIREVNDGSEVFATGNLDYRIPVTSDDEIGRLARRLNLMAEQLRSVTSSRDELEREKQGRGQAECALQESERKFRNLYQYAQVGLFETSFRDATIVACNQRYADLAGFESVEDAIGKDILHLYDHPEDRTEVGRVLREQGFIESQTLELRNQKTGRIFWGQFSARYNYERETAEGSIIDVTAQKEALENLRISEEQYRQILETMQDAYFRADAAGIITMANPAAVTLYGYGSLDEMTGIPAASLYASSDDRTEMLRHLDAEGRVYDYSGRGKRKDGSLFWVSLNVRVTFDTARKVVASEGFVRDITDRKKAEEELLLKNIAFESSIAANSIADNQGVITHVNPAFLRLWGYRSQEEAVGKSVSSFFAREPDAATVLEVLNTLGRWEGEFLAQRTDGSTFISQGIATVIQDVTGEPIGYQSTNLDVTGRKQAEEALRVSEERFRGVIDATPFPVAVVDQEDKNIEFWSRGALALFGHTAPTAAEWYQLAYPDPAYRHDVIERWKPALEQARRTGSAVNTGEYRVSCRDGSVRICELYAAFLAGKLIVTFNDITEQKQAGDAIRENEKILSATVEKFNESQSIARIGSLELDIATGNVWWSDELYRIFGVEPGTYVPSVEANAKFIHPDDNEPFHQEVFAAFGTGGSIDRVIRIITPDGGTKHCRFVARVILDDDKKAVKLIGTFSDITEIRRAEDKMTSSETRYRRLFESAKDGILILNRDTGEIIDANPFIETLLGYAPQDLLGKHLWDIGLFKDQLLSRVAFEELQAKEYLRYEDLPLETKDGKKIEVEFVSNVYAVDSRISVIQCNIRDITDRKRAEESLRETNEYLQNLFNYANAPIIVWDPELRITRFNHAFERLTGRTEQEVIGRHLSLLFPDLSRKASIEQIQKTLAGERWNVVEIPILHISGETRTVLWNSAGIAGPDGKILSTIAQGQDITDRKLTEQQREALIGELEVKNAELERFTYTVSHDLKSPLITIRGFAGLIEDDARSGDPVQLKKDVQRITAAADTMQELLADVLELSRVGRVIAPPETTPFGTIAREAVELLAGPLAERGVTVEIAPDLPLVKADHARIREVMVNLIENAVKFSGNRPDPVIRIGADASGEMPVFFVADNGIGIDPRYLERIFNLFERLDTSSPGTGVGLTIVKRIIEVHGGRIWAESEGPGKGTTFTFTLPGVPPVQDVEREPAD